MAIGNRQRVVGKMQGHGMPWPYKTVGRMQVTKIRKIIIGLMLAFYLAVITCDKSYYFSYHLTYHSIVLDHDPYILFLDSIVDYPSNFKPGRFVKQPASFYPGLNMIKINEYRFSLN